MVAKDIGEWYRVVIWHEKPETLANKVIVTGTTKKCKFIPNMEANAMVGEVPVEADNPREGITIKQRV